MAANTVLQKLARNQKAVQLVDQEAQDRIDRIVNGANPVQQRFLKDRSKRKSLRVPRRGGKSFAMSSNALLIGEEIPGARILIISLTLKSTKENFWNGPGGIKWQNHLYKLGLKYNETDYVWHHLNGSRGRLAGAETRADMEYLRGAAAEADVVIIDECKSFAPALLTELIRDVIEPGLMTRGGILIMGGTPGSIPVGEFYAATQPGIRKDANNPKSKDTCYPYTKTRTDKIWSLHTWTIADNVAKPDQWNDALENKQSRETSDSDPRWRREYLGEWVTDSFELVYAYAKCKSAGKCFWTPNRTKDNPCGLPLPLSQWRLIMGLDFGYEDMNAIVVAAYSEISKELRHVYDFKQNHMTIDKFGAEIQHTVSLFGEPDVIVGDKGSLGGVLYVQELQSRFGISVIEAEKREKFDHIELLNSDFYSDRVQIIYNSDLDHELCGLQWDLEKDSKERLIRTGKLRENPSCANHLSDALLYLWRYCYHYWAVAEEVRIIVGSAEWWKDRERTSIERLREKKSSNYIEKTLDSLHDSDIMGIYSLVEELYDFS